MLLWNEEWLRIANAILAFSSLAVLNANMVIRRQKITRRTRRVMIWVYGMLVVLGYGSGKALAGHQPITEVTYGIFFVTMGMLVSLLWHPEGDDQVPPDDGSFGQRLLDVFEELLHYNKK